MRQATILCGALMFLLPVRFEAQTASVPQNVPTYGLSVSVDEVVITFHAAGSDGSFVNDLKLGEMRLLDNGKPPTRIIDFRLLQDLPIRAGILLDTSDSMHEQSSRNRMIATQFAQQVLRRKADEAFVMDFGRVSHELQPVTNDPAALTVAVRKSPAAGPSGIRGTAIFDTIFRACLYEFGKVDNTESGNFILLLSDGLDNASDVSLQDGVDMCQRTNTAIYVFRPEAQGTPGSTGPATLMQLTSQTGGRVFSGQDSAEEVATDLRAADSDQRNQYRLVYKPAALVHDGSFHSIVLEGPERAKSIVVRSGYYAPAH